MGAKTLTQIVAEKPFTDFNDWWPMGTEFLNFMSKAIVSEWRQLSGNDGDLTHVNAHVAEYISTVFKRDARVGLVDEFVNKSYTQTIESGEFDAISYAFYRSTFELMAQHIDQYEQSLARERRLYTKRVGKMSSLRVRSIVSVHSWPHRAICGITSALPLRSTLRLAMFRFNRVMGMYCPICKIRTSRMASMKWAIRSFSPQPSISIILWGKLNIIRPALSKNCLIGWAMKRERPMTSIPSTIRQIW